MTCYALLEIFSLLVLSLLEEVYQLTYTPILTTSLSEKNRKILINLLNENTKYLTHSSQLGWTIKKNGSSPLYQANSQGIRASREYQLTCPQDRIRISSFGDSFTHCDDVKNEDTWQEKLNRANPNLQVINFGVGGFGLGQSYLRYQLEGIKYNSHIVLIGFMSENILRTVNIFRPFYAPNTGIPLTKPYFTLKNDRLVLNKNPMQALSQVRMLLDHSRAVLPELAGIDPHFDTRYKRERIDFLPSVRLFKMAWYKFVKGSHIISKGYYNENSEAFAITVKLLDQFYSTVLHNNAVPIILIFPSHRDIPRYRKHKTKVYAPLLTYLNTGKYRYIDLLDAFDMYGEKFKINELFKLHHSPLANELIAKYILEYLRKEGLDNLNL